MTAEHTTPGPQRERKQVVPLGSTGVEPEKPKMQAQTPAPQKEVTIETADGPVKRRRRASVGGFSLKLGAKTRPGFTSRKVRLSA